MKHVALSEVKDDLSKYLRLAEKEEVIITRHGKPAGILIGFESEDEWFEYRLEHDPVFLQRVERARQSLRAGRGVKSGGCRSLITAVYLLSCADLGGFYRQSSRACRSIRSIIWPGLPANENLRGLVFARRGTRPILRV